MLTINTNLSSIIAQNSMSKSTNLLNQAIERMSTGFKINHSKDNAANYSIVTNMNSQISSYEVAQDNCAMGLDMLTTADESLGLISDKLARLRDLQTQASNGTYGEQSLNAINAEAKALVNEIYRIYNIADYNGKKLFKINNTTNNATTYASTSTKDADTGFIEAITRRDTSMMTTLASVDSTTALTDGTYSISTPDEMKKLADMTDAGLISEGDEFVLANDIDLSSYSNWTPIGTAKHFYGNFDGNGHTISNLYVDDTKADGVSEGVGLFGTTNGDIKNLIVADAYVKTINGSAGVIVGNSVGSTIENCSASGFVQAMYAGGLVGHFNTSSKIINSNSSVDVVGERFAGGLLGFHFWAVTTITNSFSTGDVYATGENGYAGGLTGSIWTSSLAKITNSYSQGKITGANVGLITGLIYAGQDNCIENSYGNSDANPGMNIYGENRETTDLVFDSAGGKSVTEIVASIPSLYNYSTAIENLCNLQVGINSDLGSSISVGTNFSTKGLSKLRGIGYIDCFEEIDNLLSLVNAKQTEYGVVQNRLESALESIEVSINNLTSSRSTLRDADIAQVSSQYIQQQILQQASATLLSTANQTPAIALQLI